MPGLIAFTRDSRMMAITPSARSLQLIDTMAGRPLASLTAPDPREIRGIAFSTDDSQLAAATDSPAIEVWDLSLIRQHLAMMQLDWDLPTYPQRPVNTDSTELQLRLRVLP